MSTDGTPNRYVDYSEFQPLGSLDEEMMRDPYELSDEDLVLDPFEAAPKKKAPAKPKSKGKEKTKSEDFAEKNQEIAGDITKVLDKVNKTLSQVNPGASEGTTIDDLTDDVGTGEHAVPVKLITDHRGEVRLGVEPASCRQCGEPMNDHAQWSPTTQAGDPRRASAEWEEIGWMDEAPTDSRPRRGE